MFWGGLNYFHQKDKTMQLILGRENNLMMMSLGMAFVFFHACYTQTSAKYNATFYYALQAASQPAQLRSQLLWETWRREREPHPGRKHKSAQSSLNSHKSLTHIASIYFYSTVATMKQEVHLYKPTTACLLFFNLKLPKGKFWSISHRVLHVCCMRENHECQCKCKH